MDQKECGRCATVRAVSAIGASLFNFVCDVCRKDNAVFEKSGEDEDVK